MTSSATLTPRGILRVGRRRRPPIDLASLVQARHETDDPRHQFTTFDRM
ncbi:MAG: hypothetical protein HKN44_15275 [Ilumatobacter sp.]|nr:hypothetical protein [Ilumatobacter sp.]